MKVYQVSRRRRSRLRRLLAGLLVVVLVAVFAYVVIDKRVVVPGVSDRLYPLEYRDAIAQVADTYDVDPYLVAAVARTESGYDPQAVSHAGAVGLMQLMPETAAWIVQSARWQGADDPDLTDPEDNLELGTCYLAYLGERFGADERAVVAAYNAGQGIVSTWLAEADGKALDLDGIVYPETRAFVQRVEEWLEYYQRAYPDAFD